MKRICMVLPCNIYVIPYFKVYDQLMTEMGCSYDLLIWNRDCIKEECSGTVYSYNVKDLANDKNPWKIFKYYGFYRFVKNRISNVKYDKIIFLDTSACTVALLNKFLKKNYCYKYWVDIRDYTFENVKFYKNMLQRSFESAYCCDVSSKGFFEFLPDVPRCCITHNVDYDTIEAVKKLPGILSDSVRISFIGNVRYYDINCKLLQLFKNDNRFMLQFYGTGSELLASYAKENDIQNTDFAGRFPFSETPRYYQKTDLINNIYGNDSMEVTTALSNKLYYSIYLNKPILVSPGTYMSQICQKYDLGFTMNLDDKNLPDNLYNWYLEYKEKKPDKRLKARQMVENEFENYIKKLEEFINS